MKISKINIKWTLVSVIFCLSGCTSPNTQSPKPNQQLPTQPVVAMTVTCPEKEGCNINNYEKYIYSSGTKCKLSCVKASGVDATDWAWDNIPSKYSKGCNDFKDVKLVSTFFICAELIGLNWSKKDLTNSDLSGANLAYANLQGAILTNTNMKETLVIGANLDTDLTTTDLTDAIYNEKTKFPQNFSPKEKGMIKSN